MTRQLSMTEGKIGPALLSFAVPVLMSGFLQAPVSYTHLDVYKRQMSHGGKSAL